VSSSEKSVRSLTFTFQRTGKADARGASHSFGSQLKRTPRKRSRSSTGAKSVAANCGSISLKTAPGPRASSAISGHRRIVTTTVEATVEAATTAVAAATRAPSSGRRSQKAVAEAYAAKSEASSSDANQHEGLKISGEVLTPPECPLCCTRRSVTLGLPCRRVADQPPTVVR
jgi:hypothetical protein